MTAKCKLDTRSLDEGWQSRAEILERLSHCIPMEKWLIAEHDSVKKADVFSDQESDMYCTAQHSSMVAVKRSSLVAVPCSRHHH